MRTTALEDDERTDRLEPDRSRAECRLLADDTRPFVFVPAANLDRPTGKHARSAREGSVQATPVRLGRRTPERRPLAEQARETDKGRQDALVGGEICLIGSEERFRRNPSEGLEREASVPSKARTRLPETSRDRTKASRRRFPHVLLQGALAASGWRQRAPVPTPAGRSATDREADLLGAPQSPVEISRPGRLPLDPIELRFVQWPGSDGYPRTPAAREHCRDREEDGETRHGLSIATGRALATPG